MNRNPIALIAALIPTTLALVVWLNPFASLVALALWATLGLATGKLRSVWHPTTWVVLGAAATAWVSMALYGQASGDDLFTLGPARVSEGSIVIANATALRLGAIALPSIAVFRQLDLTAVADACEQTLRIPSRIVWGSFAGLRQLELARDDWQTARLVRRARGIESRGRATRLGQALIGVFTLAIERGGDLAITLENRGLSRGTRRPSRPSPWTPTDTALVALGCALGSIVAAAALATGGNIA